MTKRRRKKTRRKREIERLVKKLQLSLVRLTRDLSRHDPYARGRYISPRVFKHANLILARKDPEGIVRDIAYALAWYLRRTKELSGFNEIMAIAEADFLDKARAWYNRNRLSIAQLFLDMK